jgi:UDP-glucose 4-epimerase
MTRVLVTHADEPLGRRIVKKLFHDPDVEQIFAIGAGPPPRAFDPYLSGDARVVYARVDMAQHRPIRELFHSARFRSAEIDTVVYVPRHAAAPGRRAPLVAGLPERTAESRLLLQNCLETASISNLVAIGSAFVYRLPPGNANRLDEESELNLDPDVAPDVRSWIDSDMIFHGEVHNDRLRVVLLRVATVVGEGGCVYLNPSLSGQRGTRLRALGYDPICALVSDKDVAGAVAAALHTQASGIFNIAGNDAVPLSLLAAWTGRASVPVPGGVLRWVAPAAHRLGWDPQATAGGAHLRFGFTLNTRLAETELGFRSQYRIGLGRDGDGAMRIETAANS